MKQDELISKIASDAGLTKVQVGQVLQSLGKTVGTALKSGDDVTLPSIGKFSAKQRSARMATNPRTKEPIQVPAKTVPHFSAAKALKDAVI